MEVWSPRELWKDSAIRRIMFPDVSQVGILAASISYYNGIIAKEVLLELDTDGDGHIRVAELQAGIDAGLVEAHHIMGTNFFTTGDMVMLGSTIPFTLTSLALGMMLAFRTQNWNARYNEARGIWGGMVNEGRALSSRMLAAGSSSQRVCSLYFHHACRQIHHGIFSYPEIPYHNRRTLP